MNIQNISKKDREVTVELSADELVKLCNVLYSTEDKHKNELYYQLYSELMMARDLCQYGHVDNFCLGNIVKCRNSYGKGLNGVLSEEDIATFNAYIESNDMPIAFENSDWCEIYSKIVGRKRSDKIEKWIDRARNE